MTNRKNKLLHIITLGMILSLIFMNTLVYATEEEDTVKDTKNFSSTLGMLLNPNDVDVAFQKANERYLSDSTNFTTPPRVEAGASVDSGIVVENLLTYTSNGNSSQVGSFNLVFYQTETMNKDTWVDYHANEYNYTPEKIQALKENGVLDDKFLSGTHPEYYEKTGSQEYIVTCEFVELAEGGYKLIMNIPNNWPDNGTLKGMKAILEDGTIIDLPIFKQIYFSNGDGGLSYDPSAGEGGSFLVTELEEGNCKGTIRISPIEYKYMTPNRSASISNPVYDVSTSIPTSEELGFSGTADDSLHYIIVRRYDVELGVEKIRLIGKATYDKKVTKTQVIEKAQKNESGEIIKPAVTKKVTKIEKEEYTKVIETSYNKKVSETYYDVSTSNVYPVQSMSIKGGPVSSSFGLQGGEQGPQTQVITVKLTNPGLGASYTKNFGHFSTKKEAVDAVLKGEETIKKSIENILLSSIKQEGNVNYYYRGLNVTQELLNGEPMLPNKSSNGNIQVIPESALNKNYNTYGEVYYQGRYKFNVGVNDVFVHTPVINTSYTIIEPFINQRTVQDNSKKYLMLDKSFIIDFSNEKMNEDDSELYNPFLQKGYNNPYITYGNKTLQNRKETSWGKIKDVKLPFDAYLHEGNTMRLIKAGTWLSEIGKDGKERKVDVTKLQYMFTIPVWAQEGDGVIETRVIAENATENLYGAAQENANLDFNNYVATKNINVEVIGKIYDLRISSTNDPGWQIIKGKNGNYISAEEFAFGQAGQNGVQAYKYAPKLGYTVEFDFKTKGIKTDNVDVSVEPEGFYFVGKNGGTAQEVDLYYQTTGAKYVKIEKGATNSPIIVNLSNPFMKVIKSELLDSQRIMKNTIGVIYTYAENVNIGMLPELSLPGKLRLTYNNFAEYINKLYGKSENAIIVDAANRLSYSTAGFEKVKTGKDVVIASVGHWYAAYRLPSSTIAVPVGTTPQQIVSNPGIIKRDGYILVKFDIVGNSGNTDYLRYTGPESLAEGEAGTYIKDQNGNEQKWQDPVTGNPDPEDPTKPAILPNGNPARIPDGATIIFETELKASNDYETEGTH